MARLWFVAAGAGLAERVPGRVARSKGGKEHGYQLHPEVLRALRVYREHQQREARRHPAMARALADPETAYVFLTKNDGTLWCY